MKRNTERWRRLAGWLCVSLAIVCAFCLFCSHFHRCEGTLKVAEAEDQPFTDMYGYQFNYKIVDATYTILQAEELSQNMALRQALAEKALQELANENYTSQMQYIERFDTEDLVYTLNLGEELVQEMNALYYAFANWLGSWEL